MEVGRDWELAVVAGSVESLWGFVALADEMGRIVCRPTLPVVQTTAAE